MGMRLRSCILVALFGICLTGVVQPNYSVDGIPIGSSVNALERRFGRPTSSTAYASVWLTTAGGKRIVTADRNGRIVGIDVLAGPHERRDIELPSGSATGAFELGETSHVNYYPYPNGAVLNDRCGATLSGSPCEAFTLPNGLEFVINFGMDNGTADWAMSEVILASREALIKRGVIRAV
jgi:hypothetical protein